MALYSEGEHNEFTLMLPDEVLVVGPISATLGHCDDSTVPPLVVSTPLEIPF